MVRVGFPGGPRLEWYDRNPQIQRQRYLHDGLAPHAATLRFSYTVPTGKKAYINMLLVALLRVTAATTVGEAKGYFIIEGSESLMVHLWGNAVNDGRELVGGAGALLSAGEVITAYTGDASEGGTIMYFLSLLAVEFDA